MDTTAPEPPKPSIVLTVIIVLAALVLWLVAIGELVWMVPFFERMFADFKMRLPDSTEAIIGASRWCVKYFLVLPLVFTILAVAVAVSTWLIRHMARKRWLGWVWSAAMLVVPALVAFAILLFCYLPYVKLLGGW